jgi:tetratricopeptide (TPR) repeat protein
VRTTLVICAFTALSLSYSIFDFAAEPSPAEQRIAAAENAIRKNPQKAEGYSDLAMALARRARETSDTVCYAKADDALRKALELSPNNFTAQKTHVWILLGRHEFASALKEAEILNRRMPDDIQVYGFLADANIELGHYTEAEKAAQWMLNLRPGNIGGLTRGAYLRELMGDVEGAIELMIEAYQETPPAEVEDRAWIMVQVAHLQASLGRLDVAEHLLKTALDLFPDYHYALENLAQIRTAQQKDQEAVELLRRRNQNVPQPESIYALAEALERAGRQEAARVAYTQFLDSARRQTQLADNANRELVFYFTEHGANPAEALRIATMEYERRQDVFTLDAYAWALYSNGQFAAAQQQMDRALAYGTRNPKFFFHTGVIASKLHESPKAARFLKQSLESNTWTDFAGTARRVLAALPPPTEGSVNR